MPANSQRRRGEGKRTRPKGPILVNVPSFTDQEPHIEAYVRWRQKHGSVYRRVLVELCGGNRNCADLLHQLLYWTVDPRDGTTRLRYEWPEHSGFLHLVKTASELELEIGIKRKALEGAREFFRSLNVLHIDRHQSRVHRGGVASHYEVRFKELNRQFAVALIRLLLQFGPPGNHERVSLYRQLERFANALKPLRGYLRKRDIPVALRGVMEQRIDLLQDLDAKLGRSPRPTLKMKLAQVRETGKSFDALYEALFGVALKPLHDEGSIIEEVKRKRELAAQSYPFEGDGAPFLGFDPEIRRLQLGLLEEQFNAYSAIRSDYDSAEDAEKSTRSSKARRRQTLKNAWELSLGFTLRMEDLEGVRRHLESVTGDSDPYVELVAAIAACGCAQTRIEVNRVLQSIMTLDRKEIPHLYEQIALPVRFGLPSTSVAQLELALRKWYDKKVTSTSFPAYAARAFSASQDEVFVKSRTLVEMTTRDGIWELRGLLIRKLAEAVRYAWTFGEFERAAATAYSEQRD